MRKIKDVLRLKLDSQLSHEHIAAALGISKGIVTKIRQPGRYGRAGPANRPGSGRNLKKAVAKAAPG